MMSRFRPLISLVSIAIFALALNGCGNSKPAMPGSNSHIAVGVVFDSGGIGDNSFNDSANKGLEKAKADFHVTTQTVQSQTENDYQTNIQSLADNGCNLVIAVGLNQADALKAVAPKYPNVKFAIVDGEVAAPNVRSLHFSEEQGSFLAGFLAANVTKTDKLGFVGGEDLDLIRKFYAGYAGGAHYANPAVTVLPPKFVGDWDNVDTAKADAVQLFSSGADIVYHAAGRAGQGVIEAAKEQGKLAIGVDQDQDALAPGFVLTSMVKHVDVSVYQTIKDVVDNKFTPGDKVYDLKDDGVGLTDMKYTQKYVTPALLKKLDQVKADIISGKIKPPATMAELATYLKTTP